MRSTAEVKKGRPGGRPFSALAPAGWGEYLASCEVRPGIVPHPTDKASTLSSVLISNPLPGQREGSGGRVIERTQERTKGAAGADPGGADTRGSRASHRSHQGGEGDLLAYALGDTYRLNAENHFWGLEGTGL